MEERALGWLSRLGLSHIGLDDRVGRLSGGETVMTALAALFLRRPAVIALDEPTNNLDLDARRRLTLAVESWPGVMLIVSHDRELLGLVDQIADLSDGTPADVRRQPRGVQGDAGGRAGRGAARGQRGGSGCAAGETGPVSSETKQARRDRQGRRSRRRAASRASSRTRASARPRRRRGGTGTCTWSGSLPRESRLAEAEEAVRDDDTIRIALPETAVPAGRTVLSVPGWTGGRGIRLAGSPSAGRRSAS